MKLSVIQNAFENVKKFSQEKLVEKYTNLKQQFNDIKNLRF